MRPPTPRSELRFALLIAATYLVIAGALAVHHEPWRDELQAWLIARASPTPLDLPHNLRYEGHPGLWHLLLWPLTRLGGPELMQVLAVLLGAGVTFVFALAAPFRLSARTLLAFGQLALWEWGAIARNYGLGALLLFSATALAVRRERHAARVGLLLGLAAMTSVHAAIVVGGMLALFLVERISPWADASRRARALPFWSGIGLTLAGLAASALQIIPPADSAVQNAWLSRSLGHRIGKTLLAPVHGIATMPWGGPLDGQDLLWVVMFVPALLVTLFVVVTASTSLARQRGAWLVALLPTLVLEALFFLRYYGGARHASFILIALLIALWLAPTYPARTEQPGGLGARVGARAQTALVVALGFQVAMAGVQAALDVPAVYSASRATAQLIRDAGLSERPLVFDPDFSTCGVLAYLGRGSAYFANVERDGSFAIWDARHDTARPLAERATDRAVLDRAAERAGSTGAVLVVDRPLDHALAEQAHARLVGARRADFRRDESFWVYEVLAPPQTSAR